MLTYVQISRGVAIIALSKLLSILLSHLCLRNICLENAVEKPRTTLRFRVTISVILF